jgi:hypothetical protein
VRPSHGRPRGHRPIVRPSVRPSENVRVTTLPTACWQSLQDSEVPLRIEAVGT